MQIKIQNSEEFLRLLNALVDELVAAQIHFKLRQDLYAAMPEYSEEFGQSWTFWSLTLEAHMDAVVHRLCRAYDQRGGSPPSLNLRNLLDTIEANLHFFVSFRQACVIERTRLILGCFAVTALG